MKTTLISLITAFHFIVGSINAQENPWQTGSRENPWDNSENQSISNSTSNSSKQQLSVEEVLFIYDGYTTRTRKGALELNSEMNSHVNKTYKSAPMFWTNWATGLLLNVYSIPLNLITSGLPSKRTKMAFAEFRWNNPDLDEETLSKYHRKLRLKKFLSGLGGTAAGIATGFVVILVLFAI